jgi:hypothetical protein
MPYYKKYSVFFVLLFNCLLASAAPQYIAVKNADLKVFGGTYMLNADLEISLGEKVEEAINKGVPVEFVYEFELLRPRFLWIDAEVIKTKTRIKLSYHALSRQYLVSQDGRQTSHEILSEAMIELVQLYDWKVFNQSVIKPGQKYEAKLNMRLDQSKLPKAIQVDAIGSEDWSLASEAFEWTPKDLNH